MNLSKLKDYAPAIAVAVIVIGFLIAEFIVLPALHETPSPAAPTAPAATAVPAPTPTPVATAPQPATATTPAPPTDTAHWSSFHGGNGLTGFSTKQFPDALAQRWQFLAEGPVFQPPLADANSVYVVTSTGNVVALDLLGQPRWTKSIAGTTKENVEAPAFLNGDTLLIGTQSGRLIALDTASGAPRWEYSVTGQILGSPNADPASGTVFALERAEGVLHAVDAATGTLRWKTDPIARCDGHVSVADGIVAFGSCLPAIHAYAAADGKRIAEISLCPDCQIAGGVALLGTEAYAGNRSGNLVRADLRAGSIVWKNEDTKKEIFTTPALSAELALYATEDGAVIAVERATGKARWQHEAGGLASSPIIIGDKVAVSVRGVLHLLHLDTGAPVGQFEVSDNISPPALAGDLLLVGSEDGTVTAFGAPGATP